MVAPFEASKLKMARAKKHLQELEEASAAYLAERPCILVVEPFPGMNPDACHAWMARIRRPVPASLSPIIGDVVHNLRTSLDLLACDLVRLSGRSTKQVYFPFCETAASLPATIKDRNLNRAGPDVVRVIEGLRPYANGNIPLRAVHDMDVADKHQAMLPMLGALSVPVATILGAGVEFPLPQFSSLIVKDGQIIVGLPAVPNLPLGIELPSRIFLAFGDGAGFGRRPVIDFLRQFCEVVDGVFDMLTALRPAATFPNPPVGEAPP